MPSTISQDDIEDLVARNGAFLQALDNALAHRRSYGGEIGVLVSRIQQAAADDFLERTPAMTLCWNVSPQEQVALDQWIATQGGTATVAQLLNVAAHRNTPENARLARSMPQLIERTYRLNSLASSYAQVGLSSGAGRSPLERALMLALEAQYQLDRRYAALEAAREDYTLTAQPLVSQLEQVKSDLGWAVMSRGRKAGLQRIYEDLARWDAAHFGTVRKALEFLSEPSASSSLAAEQDLTTDRGWFEAQLEGPWPGITGAQTQASASAASYVRLVQLLQKARKLLGTGPDQVREEVTARANAIRSREAAEFLHSVPIEALDPGSTALGCAALRQAGCATVADLLEQEPADGTGSGAQVDAARERALRFRDHIRAHAHVRLSTGSGQRPDPTGDSERLLVSLCRSLHLHEDLVPPRDVVQATYDALLPWVNQLDKELLGPRPLFGSPRRGPEPGQVFLQQLESKQFEKHLRAQLAPLEAIASIDGEAALAEFARDPEKFRAELRRISPDAAADDPAANGDATAGSSPLTANIRPVDSSSSAANSGFPTPESDSPSTGSGSPVAKPLENYVTLVNLVLQARSALSGQARYLRGIAEANRGANGDAVTQFLNRCPIEVLRYECRAADLEACRQYGCTTVGQLLTTSEATIGLGSSSLRRLKTAAAQLTLMARNSTLTDLTASPPGDKAIELVLALERHLVMEEPFRNVARTLKAVEDAAGRACEALLQPEKTGRPHKELLLASDAEALASLVQALDTLESAQTRAERITAQAAASDLQNIANHLQQTVASVVSPSLARAASGVPVALTGFADASALVADAWEGYYRFRYPSVFAAEAASADTFATARERFVSQRVTQKLDHTPLNILIERIPARSLSREDGVLLRLHLDTAGFTTVGDIVRASKVGCAGLDPNGSVDGATLAASVATTAEAAGASTDAAKALGYGITLLRGRACKRAQIDLSNIGLGSNTADERSLRVAIFQAAAAEDGGSLVKESYTSADQDLASISHELFAVDWDEDKTVAAETAAMERAQDELLHLQADGGPIKTLLTLLST